MVCLDTTFLVDLVRAKPEAEKKLLCYLENDERITTTPVNAAELFEGTYSKRPEELRRRGSGESWNTRRFSISLWLFVRNTESL